MNTILIRIICILVGYCFGMFQTAFFLGKLKGIDIREHGSGNAGTTNTLRVLGTKAGLIVFVGDLAKTIIAVVILRNIFKYTCPDIYPGMLQLIVLYTGSGCILGHNFPFYLNFKGGKGIATTAGMIISLTPWYFIPTGVILFFGNLFITHIVSIGSLLIFVGFLIQSIILGFTGGYGPDMTTAHLIEIDIIIFLQGCLACFMHRENIKRLIAGNERKTYLFKKKKMNPETNKDAEKTVSANEEEK